MEMDSEIFKNLQSWAPLYIRVKEYNPGTTRYVDQQ